MTECKDIVNSKMVSQKAPRLQLARMTSFDRNLFDSESKS
jgi:hypothetical protein